MNDLIMLSTPVLTGLFLGQSAFLYRCLGQLQPRSEATSPVSQPETALESTFSEDAEIWAQIQKESSSERLNMARRALDAIPDVSCDAVADALGLPALRVRRLSTKSRRKGKQVTEVGTYTHEQILTAAAECPF